MGSDLKELTKMGMKLSEEAEQKSYVKKVW